MNMNKVLATALVTFIAFGSLTFIPANADSLDSSSAKATGTETHVAQIGTETPQHLVWDMTYGDQSPAEAADDPVVVTEITEVTDLSMG
jgi:hypothetical protein